MKNKEVIQNTEITIVSLAILVGAVLIGLFAPIHFTNVFRSWTGWTTFDLLGLATIAYIAICKEKILYRIITIPMLIILFGGYFLYLWFGLEAYKFAASALVFDIGTSLIAINVIVRLNLLGKLITWLKKKTKKV